MDLRTQFIRYAAVGVLSNLVLYLVYLALTAQGLGHKLAMTIVYLSGVSVTFIFNRNWSFRHAGAVSPALVRYFVAYLLFYLANLFALFVFVDLAGWPHEWVQGVMIVLCAIGLFATHRLWVFPAKYDVSVS